MEFIQELYSVLERSVPLGERRLANGARLVGHVPQVAPEAYLHALFPGLQPADVARLESEIGRPLPAPLRQLYELHNGLHLFGGALSLLGLRDPFLEGDVGEVGQPFSMDGFNQEERPAGAPKDAVFFGFYDWDGSLLFMRQDDARVFRCSRDHARPVNVWPDLGAAVVREVRRLAGLFGPRGDALDELAPTTPPSEV